MWTAEGDSPTLLVTTVGTGQWGCIRTSPPVLQGDTMLPCTQWTMHSQAEFLRLCYSVRGFVRSDSERPGVFLGLLKLDLPAVFMEWGWGAHDWCLGRSPVCFYLDTFARWPQMPAILEFARRLLRLSSSCYGLSLMPLYRAEKTEGKSPRYPAWHPLHFQTQTQTLTQGPLPTGQPAANHVNDSCHMAWAWHLPEATVSPHLQMCNCL